jgi:anti-anti-sigma factor
VFDCNKLEYISSSGLRLLLGVLKNAKPKGSRVFITGINDDLRTVFAMTGFTNLFEFK